MQFAVGFKVQGKKGHVVVDAEDALIAALKVKMQRPEALIPTSAGKTSEVTPVIQWADSAAIAFDGQSLLLACEGVLPVHQLHGVNFETRKIGSGP